MCVKNKTAIVLRFLMKDHLVAVEECWDKIRARQIHQKYARGKGPGLYISWSLTTESYTGSPCRYEVHWSKVFGQKNCCFPEKSMEEKLKILSVAFLVSRALKSTLRYAYYNIVWDAFLISRTSDWHTSYESDSRRDCRHRCTQAWMLLKTSLTVSGSLEDQRQKDFCRVLCWLLRGKISALDPHIYVELLISAACRLFFHWVEWFALHWVIGARVWAVCCSFYIFMVYLLLNNS